jgi:hypothetical protein
MIVGVYLLTHGGVVPGHERFVPSVFETALKIWRKHDDITPLGPFFLTPGSGSRDHMAFMSLYQGKLARLQEIITSEDYERFWAVAAQVLKNLSGRLYGGGDREEIKKIMTGAAQAWGDAGLIGGSPRPRGAQRATRPPSRK